MISTPARLTFRMHRFEVGAILVLGGLLLLGSVAFGLLLASVTLGPECQLSEFGEVPEACLSSYLRFQEISGSAGPLVLLTTFFPFLGGLLVGGPVMAREIERGTTALAWSMSASRTRWYLQRVVPIALLLLVVGFVVGAAADHLQRSLSPTTDMATSFLGFRYRGILVATEAFVMFGAAILVGALFGRAVPTALLALILGGLAIVAIGKVHERVLLVPEAELRPSEVFFGGPSGNKDFFIESRYRLPDGRLVTYNELVVIDPAVQMGEYNYPSLSLIIPGERYRFVEAREALGDLAVGCVFLAGAAIVVLRRRPT
ncbi:MAG TPA: hypothetical protein VGQ64_05800 [Candidatus Limnocylindrales bacterium]|nr:hypothetical protein [Candidatus Limnocylindrales bacterium]